MNAQRTEILAAPRDRKVQEEVGLRLRGHQRAPQLHPANPARREVGQHAPPTAHG